MQQAVRGRGKGDLSCQSIHVIVDPWQHTRRGVKENRTDTGQQDKDKTRGQSMGRGQVLGPGYNNVKEVMDARGRNPEGVSQQDYEAHRLRREEGKILPAVRERVNRRVKDMETIPMRCSIDAKNKLE